MQHNALKTIRAHGLNRNELWDVTRATLVSQLLYASPAWLGYLNVSVDDIRKNAQNLIRQCMTRQFVKDEK